MHSRLSIGVNVLKLLKSVALNVLNVLIWQYYTAVTSGYKRHLMIDDLILIYQK